MKTIVVAVDFSPITDKLIETAKEMAKEGSKVYCIHIAAPDPDFVGLGVGPDYIREDRASELQDQHAKLNEIKKNLLEAGVNTEALLIAGPTVDTLLEEIEKLKADLLIIGRKGHSTLYEVIIGSVCKDIIGQLDIPALIIPVPKEIE